MTDLTMLHDHDLSAMATPEAQAILDARARAASEIRVIMARMYGHPSAATFSGWNIVPHMTDRGTIGVVDVADGTAWDSMQTVADATALGLDDEHTPNANSPSMGCEVKFDGVVVQARGETPGKPITAPPGWKRIGLTTWRGYDGGDGHSKVPAELYAEPHWIRPQLRAVGLVTCYGEPGKPRKSLDDAAGHGGQNRPPWVAIHFDSARIGHLPLSAETRAELRAVGDAHLLALVRHVTRGRDWADAASEARSFGDFEKISPWPNRIMDLSPFAPRLGLMDAINDPEDRSGAAWASAIGYGDSDYYNTRRDVLAQAIQRAVMDLAGEAARTLDAAIGGLMKHPRGKYRNGLLDSIYKNAVAALLDGAPTRFDLETQVCAVIYRDGPIYLDIPAAHAA